MRCEALAHIEPWFSLFSNDQEGQDDVFKEREGRLVDDQRIPLRTGLCDEFAPAFVVQLRKRISLCFVSNGIWKTETSSDLEPVILGFPHVLLFIRSYKGATPRAERPVNQPDANIEVAYVPNAPPIDPECKNMLNGITLLPILTTEGRVLCQSTCATNRPALSSFALEDDAL